MLGFGLELGEAQLKNRFSDGLQPSICHSVWAYQGSIKKAFTQNLAQKSDSLRRHLVEMTSENNVIRWKQLMRRNGREIRNLLDAESGRAGWSGKSCEISRLTTAGQALDEFRYWILFSQP